MEIKLTDSQVHRYCLELRNKIDKAGKTYSGVYGVPMGGIPVAGILSSLLNVPLVFSLTSSDILVVDDICDSGETLKRYPDNDKAVLVSRESSSSLCNYIGTIQSGWVVFPWENSEGGVQRNLERILQYLGEDPKREGLLDTPDRIVRSYSKLYEGYGQEISSILKTDFSAENYDQIIVLRDIKFYSTCEHHMLPFFGTVHIGYLPEDKVVGISKLARLTDMYARRLQIQERMTAQIADAIQEHIKPRGVYVIVKGQHFCMTARGVEKQDAEMVTSALYGVFKDKPEARSEFLSLISLR